MSSFRSTASLIGLAILLAASPSGEAQAMCGGNVFVTCPARAKPVGKGATDAKRPVKRRDAKGDRPRPAR